MPITIFDVAKEAGCSTATVSLVMNGSPRISDKTKKHVLSIADRLGYAPNHAASALSSGRTNTIGVIIPDMRNQTYALMLEGIEEAATNHDYSIILNISNRSRDKEGDYIQMFSRKQIDGLLLFPNDLQHAIPSYLITDNKTQIPIYSCGTSIRCSDDMGYVKCDNFMGGYIATEHLIKIGRKRIACLCAVENKTLAKSRVEGYCNALEVYDAQFDASLIRYCSMQPKDIYDNTIDLIKNKKTDAVFCLYDYMALPVIQAIVALNLKVPQDIAIMGYDNSELSGLMPIPLSSVDTHPRLVGYKATELLLNKIKDPEMDVRKVILKPELVIRDSTVNSKA